MKALKLSVVLVLLALVTGLSAQKYSGYESHGGTLNLGLGIGGYSTYYGYVGHTLPVFDINYEFGVARNFTLAPFISFYSYGDPYYNHYNTIVTPIGVKGSYYLDQLLHAGSHWDFYAAGSLGFALVSTTWDANYYGDRSYYTTADPLYLDFHLGTEYHFTNHIGAFVDLSTGISTIGIAIH